ncbi:hypothetical protein N7449_000519 [Penicillium cf. viridicatum]|uniref:Uncharacterized protein n=1 Tax=Penicillium cf. viridicatum TaxID=2972119 RepID=A0A9W9T9D3_9EURO|nr:hypothetical protein N7449_000519 [Penicillium cf. viridicatum]
MSTRHSFLWTAITITITGTDSACIKINTDTTAANRDIPTVSSTGVILLYSRFLTAIENTGLSTATVPDITNTLAHNDTVISRGTETL